jgi:hypothetical protein
MDSVVAQQNGETVTDFCKSYADLNPSIADTRDSVGVESVHVHVHVRYVTLSEYFVRYRKRISASKAFFIAKN